MNLPGLRTNTPKIFFLTLFYIGYNYILILFKFKYNNIIIEYIYIYNIDLIINTVYNN